MFCPQCKTECRRGFMRCADCDVELVHNPPPPAHGLGTTSEQGSHAEDSEDPFCSFWRGDDPRIHAELCELLNEEGIPHKTVRREDHLFNLNTRSGFEIGIPFSQFEKAEAAIKDAYGVEEEKKDAARPLPYGRGYVAELGDAFPRQPSLKGFARADDGQDGEPENAKVSAPEELDMGVPSETRRSDWDPTDWNPEEATLRVWSSEQSYPGKIIEMALRENQIHSRFEKVGGSNTILVLPEDELRAREITREIVEGAPQE
jgi:hypothetical protein